MAQNVNTVILAYPFVWEGKTISEITMRRAKTRDLRVVSGPDAPADRFDQGIAMIAVLSDLPVEAIDEMDAEDFVTVSELIAGFFPQAAAGETGAA